MSDIAVHDPSPDRRRMVWCLGVALVLHAAILVGLALGPGRSFFTPTIKPIPVEIELTGAPLVPDATIAPVNPGSASGAAASVPSASTKPGSPASGGVDSAGFIIPTPRAQIANQPATRGGSGFTVSGTQTSGAQPLPDIANQPSLAAIAAAQQGKGNGSGASSGQGTGVTQHSGKGVQVSGANGSSSNLDLSQLDKALAGNKGGGGTGGTGTGTGSGTGQGTTGTGGTGTGDQGVVWDHPDASAGRVPVFTVVPKIPEWVSKQPLSFTVVVSFTVNSNGMLSGVSVDQSSGNTEIDLAVRDALLLWRFNAAPGSPAITGKIPYVIRPK